MYDMILIRYGEMTLKKKNYKVFLAKVNQNIKSKCKDINNLSFSNTDYRFYIYLNGTDEKEVIERLDTVMGLHSYSLCKKVNSTIEDISKGAIEILKTRKGHFSFKVETNRGNKNFPMTSIEISQNVAKLVLPNIDDISVDVHNPDVTLSIDLRTEGTYIYTDIIKGLGGYPSGMAGKGLLMMSGGIDSPVAGYLSIRKGVIVNAIHFASPPYTSDMALQKVIDLLERLALYTTDGRINLYVVPFTKIQESIHENSDPIYLVTIMRRAMYKIASKMCGHTFQCIINGESIGQVASQTLESIQVVNEVTNIPIIRPLATYDKEEIIEVARKIKTYDISIRPYEDCCTVFVPEHPIIKPNLVNVLAEEQKAKLDDLIIDAINNVKEYKLSCYKKTLIFEDIGNEKFDI